MKIGIMTYHFCSNYGAVLQAYALKRFLEARGHHVEMVDYRPPNDSGALGHNLRLLLQEGYIRLMNRYSSFRLNGKFADFRRTNLSLSSMRYNSLEELKRACPEYDAYICGSDQIWNPHGQQFHEPYFLTFVPEGRRKFSYAASFGTPVLEERFRAPLQKYLQGFSGISVRENSGVDLIRDFAGKHSIQVIDPTLLHDDYSELYKNKHYPANYLLVYRLQQSAPLTRNLTRLIRHVALELNLPVYSISPQRFRFFLETGKTVYPTPAEWCGWIANASFVITNSFHGSGFSILNRRPFLSFPRVARDGQNDRITDLLHDFSLDDRYILPEEIDSFRIDTLAAYQENLIRERLSEQRHKAAEYLQNQLEMDVK